MDLQDPTSKMSKSSLSPQGTVLVLDPPDLIAKKFKRAVTDSSGEVAYDVVGKPGVSNLLSILAACTGVAPQDAADGFSQYGPLKQAAADAVIETVRPLQERYAELSADPAETARLLRAGADRARAVASVTLARAYDAIGLLSP
jgi:tryptophanyl-tRNA synthetase